MPTLLGTKLRKLRQDKGYSLDRLAELAKLSKSYLWELENREAVNPTMEKLSKLAEVLGVTTRFLLEGEETSPTEEVADKAFFRKYQKLPPQTKQKIQEILKVIQSNDHSNE